MDIEVKWIKILTGMFDDEKIKLIEAMPEADMILVIWVKLLTLAGKKNMNGFIFLTENIPYTDEMLSAIFNRPLNTIRLALDTLKKFGMIQYNKEKILQVTNWNKHQNIEGLEKIKEQNRLRQRRFKGQHLLELGQDTSNCPYCGKHTKLTIDHIIPLTKRGLDIPENKILCCLHCNQSKNNRNLVDFLNSRILLKEPININAITHNKKLMKNLIYRDGRFISVTLTPNNTLEKRVEEIKKRKEKNLTTYIEKWNKYLEPKVSALTKDRKAKLRVRLNEKEFIDSYDKILNVIKNTPFLRGDNNKNWQADFDWVIKNDTNYVKILEGKYKKPSKPQHKIQSHSEPYPEGEII